jgi:AraC-like DNA-binding protein/ligand-binding sensor protein
MHHSDKNLVETLTRSKFYRDYETAFREAVGLPLTFTPAETWGLPLHESSNEGPFCYLMARTHKACAACLEVQAALNTESAAGTRTKICTFGLRDSAVPVKLGTRVVGYLRTGQVFTQAPAEADYQRAVATLTKWGVTVQPEELRAAYFGTKVVTPNQYQAILRLLEVFAIQLGTLSNQLLVAEETQENPQITRAKEFIAANLGEMLSLETCARASRMSTFYFCKMFKRGTGLTFTEYVSRLRTEKAKQRLMDTHARVSEVAFEVGFQSLSQFNRAFRKVTGQSPSAYRRSLAVTVRTSLETAALAPRRAAFGVAGRITPQRCAAPGAYRVPVAVG